MRWNEEETYQFVKTYFAHESLWNTRHVAYKSNDRRLKAYKEMIAEFKESTGIHLTLNEARVKVKNLKSTYSQELNKIRLRSGRDYTYTPAMRWFSVWHKNIQNARKRMRNPSLEESVRAEEDCQKLWLPVDAHNDGEETDVDPFDSQHNDEYVFIAKPEPKECNKQQLQDDTNSNLDHSSRTGTPNLTGRGSLDTNLALMKEDEFDIYGKYIASQLRSMDLQRALTLQLEIQSLVSEARLAGLSNQCSNVRQIS